MGRYQAELEWLGMKHMGRRDKNPDTPVDTWVCVMFEEGFQRP